MKYYITIDSNKIETSKYGYCVDKRFYVKDFQVKLQGKNNDKATVTLDDKYKLSTKQHGKVEVLEFLEKFGYKYTTKTKGKSRVKTRHQTEKEALEVINIKFTKHYPELRVVRVGRVSEETGKYKSFRIRHADNGNEVLVRGVSLRSDGTLTKGGLEAVNTLYPVVEPVVEEIQEAIQNEVVVEEVKHPETKSIKSMVIEFFATITKFLRSY